MEYKATFTCNSYFKQDNIETTSEMVLIVKADNISEAMHNACKSVIAFWKLQYSKYGYANTYTGIYNVHLIIKGKVSIDGRLIKIEEYL